MKEKNELLTGPNTMQTVQTMQAEPVSVVAVPNKGGRPSKYTPETIEKLLRAIADGLTIR
jgi:hypothetical protein